MRGIWPIRFEDSIRTEKNDSQVPKVNDTSVPLWRGKHIHYPYFIPFDLQHIDHSAVFRLLITVPRASNEYRVGLRDGVYVKRYGFGRQTSGYSSVFVHRLAQGHSASTPIRSIALYHSRLPWVASSPRPFMANRFPMAVRGSGCKNVCSRRN